MDKPEVKNTVDVGVYPYYPIATALKIGEAVKDLGGSNTGVQKSVLASHLKEAEKSPGFAQRIASAKCFGIIEGRGTFTLTDGGKRYFLPLSESDKSSALLAFLNAPSAFAEVIKRFDGSKLPSRDILANVFHREAGVPDSWKERIASFFSSAAESVGALDSHGFLRYRAIKEGLLSKVSNGTSVSSVDTDIGYVNRSLQTAKKDTPLQQSLESNVWDFSFRGKSVRLVTPTELDKPLWEKLNAYVQLLNPEEETKQ